MSPADRQALVLKYARLAEWFARWRRWRWVPDAREVALTALCRAAAEFDPRHPLSVRHGFQAFASCYVRRALMDASVAEFRWRTRCRSMDAPLELHAAGSGQRPMTLHDVLEEPRPFVQLRELREPWAARPRRRNGHRRGRETLLARIERELRRSGPLTGRELADRLGASREGVKKQVRQLCANGQARVVDRIRRRGRAPVNVYEVAQVPEASSRWLE